MFFSDLLVPQIGYSECPNANSLIVSSLSILILVGLPSPDECYSYSPGSFPFFPYLCTLLALHCSLRRARMQYAFLVWSLEPYSATISLPLLYLFLLRWIVQLKGPFGGYISLRFSQLRAFQDLVLGYGISFLYWYALEQN